MKTVKMMKKEKAQTMKDDVSMVLEMVHVLLHCMSGLH